MKEITAHLAGDIALQWGVCLACGEPKLDTYHLRANKKITISEI